MEKEFVSYEQAVALKELGFDEPCFAWYNHNDLCFFGVDNCLDIYAGEDKRPYAPLKQQVFRWFREEYNLHHIIYKTGDDYGHIVYRAIILNANNGLVSSYQYLTYEEAEKECIDILIEILKEQKKIDLMAEISGW